MIALLAFVSVFCSVSAQKVNETVTLYGKDQLQGFTINVDNYSLDLVDDAMADLFETQYKLKGSKKKGYHVYENQSCFVFGEARYDIYFTTSEVGKKKDKKVQVTLVVSTGNMNCITFSNDPRTSRNIVSFLEKFPSEVAAYDIKLRIQNLENELSKLNKERDLLLKNRSKVEDKIVANNNELTAIGEKLDQASNELVSLQEQFNSNYDPAVKEQIDQTAKEKQNLQKSYNNSQKSLFNLNDELVKINTKLEKVEQDIVDTENELKKLK